MSSHASRSGLPRPATASPVARSGTFARRCRRKLGRLFRNYFKHALLTLSGTTMGATAIAFMIMALKTPHANPWDDPGFVVLFVVWVLAILAFMACNCARARAQPAAGANLLPAAHYLLRTLTSVLCSTVLLLERLQSADKLDDLWIFLPLAISLSACLCSVFGDAGDFLATEDPDNGGDDIEMDVSPGNRDARAGEIMSAIIGMGFA